MSSSFLALYRGPSIPQARLVAVSADPQLVADFARRLLGAAAPAALTDPVLREVEGGRRRALRLIAREGEGYADGA
jgi:hypothetical protein